MQLAAASKALDLTVTLQGTASLQGRCVTGKVCNCACRIFPILLTTQREICKHDAADLFWDALLC